VRKTRSDVISDSVKEAVVAWWISETRSSPIAKEVVRKWVAPGVHTKMHTQYLLESQVSVFSTYFVYRDEFVYFRPDPCFAIVVAVCIFLCFMFEGPAVGQIHAFHLVLQFFFCFGLCLRVQH
jgi:hypothetical protein